MKRVFWFGLVQVLFLALAACGGSGNSGSDSSSSTSSASSSTSSASSSVSSASSSSSSSSSATLGSPGAATVSIDFDVGQAQLVWDAVVSANYYRIFKNPDGSSGYKQIGGDQSETSYADAISVYQTDWINASYKVQSCNDTGCTDSDAIYLMPDDSASAIGYVKASNPHWDDYFGASVALSRDGSTMVVGAYGVEAHAAEVISSVDDQITISATNNSGAVYVFERVGNLWQQQAYIKPVTDNESLMFGYSVSISDDGDTIAIGARGDDSNATGIDGDPDNGLSGASGAVFVYTRNDDNWEQSAYIKASNAEAGDSFGNAVALSGDGSTLAVGSWLKDLYLDYLGISLRVPLAGAVYVFSNTAGAWSEQAYIEPADTNAAGSFGQGVALSNNGDVMAVYSSGPDAVYLFNRDVDEWEAGTSIDSNGTFSGALSLSDDGAVLAIGATGDSSAATAIDGDAMDTSASNSGAVLIFEFSNSMWTQQAYIKASNTDMNDKFGSAVALTGDGNTLAVGANGEDSSSTGLNGNQADNSESSSGAAYVFTRQGGGWIQRTYVKASNTTAGVNFGSALALSDDGQVLAVSDPYEKKYSLTGNQEGSSGTRVGAVYVY